MPTTPLLGVVFGNYRAGISTPEGAYSAFQELGSPGSKPQGFGAGLIGRDNGPTR